MELSKSHLPVNFELEAGHCKATQTQKNSSACCLHVCFFCGYFAFVFLGFIVVVVRSAAAIFPSSPRFALHLSSGRAIEPQAHERQCRALQEARLSGQMLPKLRGALGREEQQIVREAER